MKLISARDIPQLERIRLEDEFFSQPFMMSYSGLNKLLFSPVLFHQHYILKQRDDVVDKPMVEGKLLHCLLLNPEEFENEFVLMSSDMPSDGPRKVLDKLYECMKNEGQTYTAYESPSAMTTAFMHTYILDILKEQNLYQSLKTDEQRIAKIMLIPKNLNYLDYKFQAEKKTVVDQDMYDFAKNTVDIVKSNSKLMDLMGFNQDSLTTNVKQHNELDLVSLEFDDYYFGIRGIIDNLVIDHDNKVIRVNDLKKSSKSISQFEESIEYYNYWMQAALYRLLVNHIKTTTFGVDYPVEFRFIVVDPYMQIAPIRISEETMEAWTLKLNDELDKANYHFKEREFGLPYKFLKGENVI
jgi:bacterioferritin (cytochrome b1)